MAERGNTPGSKPDSDVGADEEAPATPTFAARVDVAFEGEGEAPPPPSDVSSGMANDDNEDGPPTMPDDARAASRCDEVDADPRNALENSADDDNAPLPPALGPASAFDGDVRAQTSETRPELEMVNDDEEDGPMQDARVASRYEEMDAYLKDVLRSMDDDDAPSPPTLEPEFASDGGGQAQNLETRIEGPNEYEEVAVPVPPTFGLDSAVGDDNKQTPETRLETVNDGDEDRPVPDALVVAQRERTDAELKHSLEGINREAATAPVPWQGPVDTMEGAVGKTVPTAAAAPPIESASGTVMPAPRVVVVDPNGDGSDGEIPREDHVDEGENGGPPMDDDDDGPGELRDQQGREGDEEEGDARSRNTIHIPDAYLVTDPPPAPAPAPPPEPAVPYVHAEPAVEWYKEKNTRTLFAIVCLLAGVAVVALGVSLSRGDGTETTEVMVLGTAPPSTSAVPTNAPTAPPPTISPTGTPSSSQEPSSSPTACVATVTAALRRLDLPMNEPSSPWLRMDGRNAVLAARDAGSSMIYVVFFYLQEDQEVGGGRRWTRTAIFTESYEESEEGLMYDISLALSDGTAFLGFPRKGVEDGGAGAGLVYIFEQGRSGDGEGSIEWTKAQESLLPEDGGSPGAYFGHSTDLYGDLAVVCAPKDKAVYVLSKTYDGEEASWQQRVRFEIGGYGAIICSLRGKTIAVSDIEFSEIRLYRYDRALNRVSPLQDALVVDPEKRKYGSMMAQIMATGTSAMVSSYRTSEDHLVYSVDTWSTEDNAWSVRGVSIYQQGGSKDNQTFSFHQYFNTSDYEDNFGSEIALYRDVLVVGGGDHTYVFAQRQNGFFEESFRLEGSFDVFQMSGRNAIAITYENEVYSMDFADCMQEMPTQAPSSSMAPSHAPSVSGRPSMTVPTTEAPTVTFGPSTVPTSSVAPSSSAAPSHAPTSSVAPTICYDVRVVIMTTGANLVGFEDDATSWQLYQEQSREVTLQGGQFRPDAMSQYDAECIGPDDYVFNITNSNGNGFGECATCGYFLFVDSNLIGVMTEFHDVDTLRFRLPLYRRMPNDNMSLMNGQPVCSGDFFLFVTTNENPLGIAWNVTDEDGDVVVDGGPYNKRNALHREFACLPDGRFTFTMYNSGEGWNQLMGALTYIIGIEWNTILLQSSLDFNTSESTTFVLGTEPTALSSQTGQPGSVENSRGHPG